MNKNLKHIKNPGFNVPDDYFQGVEDAVFSELRTQLLQDHFDDSGFNLPEGYLDTVEAKVMSKLESENTPKVINLFDRRHLVYVSGVAAALIIMFSIFMDGGNEDSNLDYGAVESYIIDQGISSYELATLLTEEELSGLNTRIMDEAFEAEQMEEYLMENIKLEEIIDQ